MCIRDRNIPEGYGGYHESINSLITYGYDSTKLKTLIAAEFSSNLKADVAIRKAFQNTGDVSIMTDGASLFFGADSEIELRHVADDG